MVILQNHVRSLWTVSPLSVKSCFWVTSDHEASSGIVLRNRARAFFVQRAADGTNFVSQLIWAKRGAHHLAQPGGVNENWQGDKYLVDMMPEELWVDKSVLNLTLHLHSGLPKLLTTTKKAASQRAVQLLRVRVLSQIYWLGRGSKKPTQRCDPTSLASKTSAHPVRSDAAAMQKCLLTRSPVQGSLYKDLCKISCLDSSRIADWWRQNPKEYCTWCLSLSID